MKGRDIGDPEDPDNKKDSEHVYHLLEDQIIPLFYDDRKKWVSMMKEAIKTGVRFTASRMINEYKDKYYKT